MRNGLFSFCSAATLNGSAALPFVIPTGAQRSGGICSSADLSWRCFTTEQWRDLLFLSLLIRVRPFVGLLQVFSGFVDRSAGVVIRLHGLPVLIHCPISLTGDVEDLA